MASAAAAQSSEEVGVGGTYSRPISGAKAVAVSAANESLVEACSGQVAAAAVATVQPLGNSAGVCWGNGFGGGAAATAAGVGIGVEDGVVRRSVVDVIAEAMRENSVQHHRNSGDGRNDSTGVGHQQQRPGAVHYSTDSRVSKCVTT